MDRPENLSATASIDASLENILCQTLDDRNFYMGDTCARKTNLKDGLMDMVERTVIEIEGYVPLSHRDFPSGIIRHPDISQLLVACFIMAGDLYC
jgi:hypothetical protein